MHIQLTKIDLNDVGKLAENVFFSPLIVLELKPAAFLYRVCRVVFLNAA